MIWIKDDGDMQPNEHQMNFCIVLPLSTHDALIFVDQGAHMFDAMLGAVINLSKICIIFHPHPISFQTTPNRTTFFVG